MAAGTGSTTGSLGRSYATSIDSNLSNRTTSGREGTILNPTTTTRCPSTEALKARDGFHSWFVFTSWCTCRNAPYHIHFTSRLHLDANKPPTHTIPTKPDTSKSLYDAPSDLYLHRLDSRHRLKLLHPTLRRTCLWGDDSLQADTSPQGDTVAMTYRDQFDALQAETERLRQNLTQTQEELEALRAKLGDATDVAPVDHRRDAQHFAFGMRCLGGVALMLPFLLMTAMCERRFTPRYHSPSPISVVEVSEQSGMGQPLFVHECGMRSRPAPGYEQFTSTTSRLSRVVSSQGYENIAVGSSCTVTVVPVSFSDFSCHVEVVCNGTTVYGALPTGYAQCDVSGPDLLRASDPETTGQDGDPAVHIDLRRGVAMVSDLMNTTRRSMVLSLEAPPVIP
jgi:hypothetical protein